MITKGSPEPFVIAVSPGTSAPGAGSLVAMDATGGSISATYHLAWRTCTP